MKSSYEIAAAAGVQLKRILTGLHRQTTFTKYLEKIQYFSRDELKNIQANRLSTILLHAVDKVPFYKNLKGNLDLAPNKVFDEIKHFPLVSRKDFAENFDKFIAPDEPYLIKLKSGGTTSDRINVLRDRMSLTDRTDEYFNRIIGIYPGRSRLMLSRHERHYYDDGSDEIEIYENRITRTYLINPTFFSREKLEKAYQLLKDKRPVILRANTTFAYEFAKAIERNGWDKLHIPIVEGSCVTMQPHYIATLERVFGAKVYDVYGATEINTTAGQCEKREGLHYVPATHYIEIMKDDGTEANENESGELIVTSLSHKAMPIIRYKIGDYATKTNKYCSCGRTFPMLKRIDGRVVETIRAKSGAYMTLHEVIQILTKLPIDLDFQVIQENDGTIIFNLCNANRKLDSTEEMYLRNSVCSILGEKNKIQFEYPNAISKQASGKTLRIISKLSEY